MSHKHHTKDELFMLCLYEEAERSGDFDSVFDRYEIGNKAHLHPKGVDAICKLLVQANFIKKSGEEGIYITQNGINLVKTLRLE
jgi:hypothetical protein